MADQNFSFTFKFDTSQAISSANEAAKALNGIKDTIQNISKSSDSIKTFANNVKSGADYLTKLATANTKSSKSLTAVSNYASSYANSLGRITNALQAYETSTTNGIKNSEKFAKSFKDIADSAKIANDALKGIKDLKNLGKGSFKLPITEGQLNRLASLGEKFAEVNAHAPEFTKTMTGIGDALLRVSDQIKPLSDSFKEFLKVISQSGKAGQILAKLADQLEKAEKITVRLGESSKKAEKDIEDLGETAKNAGEEVRELGTKATSTQNILGGLATRLAGVFAVSLSFDKIKDSASAYSDLVTKLTLIKTPAENANTILNQLFEVSSKSRQPVEATSDAYITLRKSTEKLNLSQEQLLALTETLTKAIAIGRSSAEATKNSMVQFSQALNMGYLSGQNFNSVAEQTPGLIDAIARGMGMTTAELRNYANTTKLTTEDIVRALQNNADETNRIYNKVTLSVGAALTELKNKFIKFIGENDFVSDRLAQIIQSIANNFESLIETAKYGLYVFAGYKTLGLIQTFQSTTTATTSLTVQLRALYSSLMGISTASIKARAGLIAQSVGMGILRGATIAFGVAWRTVDTIVKSTVIGLILWGIVEVIQLVIKGVKELYVQWKKFTGQTNSLDVSNIENLDERLKKAQENLDKEKEALKQAEEALATAKRRLENEQKVSLEIGYQVQSAQTEYDLQVKNLSVQKQRVQEAQKQLDLAREAANVSKEESAKTAAPVVEKPAEAPAVKSIDRFAENVKQMKNQLAEAQAKYQTFLATGQKELSQLDQINLKIAQGAEGYRNLTAAQIAQYQQLAQQLDHVNAQQRMANALADNRAAIDRLNYENSLMLVNQAQKEMLLLQYDREIALKQQLMGLTLEEQEQLRASYEERWALEDEMAERLESNTNAFVESIQNMMPTLEDFRNQATSGFNSIADGMAQMVVTGQGSIKKLIQGFLRQMATMLVKAAIIFAILFAMDRIVPGSGTMVATMFNMSAGVMPGGGGGKGGGISMPKGIPGFATGGYTGNVARNQVAGVVHGKEYVLNADATSKYGVGFLDQLNKGTLEFSQNSKRDPASGEIKVVQPVNVYNYTNAEVTQTTGVNGELEIYIKNTVREEVANTYAEMELSR